MQLRFRSVRGKEAHRRSVSPKSLGGERKSTPYPLAITSADLAICDLQSMPNSLSGSYRLSLLLAPGASRRASSVAELGHLSLPLRRLVYVSTCVMCKRGLIEAE
jgi:hypothetical protein